MKKILFLTAILAMGILTACEEDFLETAPTSSYAETTVMGTTESLLAAVNGIHKAMFTQYNSRQDQSGQGTINIVLDVLGEDLVLPHAGNGWFNNQYKWIEHRNKNSNYAYGAYRYYYKIIANANMILDYVDAATGPEADKKIIKGQALAYRGYAYYYLIQLYAKRYDSSSASSDLGVPLLTTFTADPQPRSTVAKVYDQIETDLKEAINLLAGYKRGDKSQLDVSVANGLLARAALYKGDYSNAKQYAAAARSASTGRLMNATEYKDGFNDTTNPEWLWGSVMIADQTLYFYAFHAYMSWNFNSTNIRQAPKCISRVLYDQISETDLRKTLWEPAPTTANFPLPATTYSRFPYMNRKYAVKDASSSVADVLYMRLAEMYLIEAEAKARLGESDAAQVLYNLVSTRDPAYTLSTKSGQALIDEILVQRRVELWGEGFRFGDLKRLNLPLDRRNSNHNQTLCTVLFYEAGGVDWQWHFPIDEENSNPELEPNP